jgi:hypothetical protein
MTAAKATERAAAAVFVRIYLSLTAQVNPMHERKTRTKCLKSFLTLSSPARPPFQLVGNIRRASEQNRLTQQLGDDPRLKSRKSLPARSYEKKV